MPRSGCTALNGVNPNKKKKKKKTSLKEMQLMTCRLHQQVGSTQKSNLLKKLSLLWLIVLAII